MGGGSDGGAPAPATSQAPPAPPPVPVQDYAAFSPGQQGLLAQQMQQGFGGSLLDHENAMGFYKDMQAPQISRPEQIKQYLEQVKPGSTAPAPNQQVGKGIFAGYVPPASQQVHDTAYGGGMYNTTSPYLRVYSDNGGGSLQENPNYQGPR